MTIMRPIMGPVMAPVMRSPRSGRGVTAARRLLDLIANDNGSALIWDYAKTDRRFANPDGGANPATAGDVIGLDLDSSKWGGKSLAEVLAAQPEKVVNGKFDTSVDNWTAFNGVLEWEAGRAKLIGGGTLSPQMRQALPTVAGRTYAVYADSGVFCAVGTTVTGSDLLSLASNDAKWRFFVAVGATSWLRFAGSATGTGYIDNVSVKEVPGNHARQGTAASKSKWQPGPKPFALYDGTDDSEIIDGLIPSAAGTMAIAMRADAFDPSLYKTAMSGGITTGDKRLRMGLSTAGDPAFIFNTVTGPLRPDQGQNYVGRDAILVQTWGGGKRRVYVMNNALSSPIMVETNEVANMDGVGNPYRIGGLEAGGDFHNGRVYGALIRPVISSDAEVRNIIIPAFEGLYR